MKYLALYNRVGEEAQKKVLEIIYKKFYNESIEAICLYGSRVSGYAKEDSDYDVILALRSYPKRIRYKYITDELNLSCLAVDSSLLLKDAEKANLGEFVIGRLLNPYLPLIGDDFFREAEIKYKRRVILETLYELSYNYSKFLSLVKIPLSYFLYEKLRRRASFYPPAVYSYSKTYSSELRDVNLKYALENFKVAAKELEKEGYLTFLEDNYIEVPDYALNKWKKVKMISLINLKRKIKHYAIHGYAGRVSLKIVGKEVASKLSRFREVNELPKEIKAPKNLWTLPEGRILEEGENWMDVIAEEYNLQEPFSIHSQNLGEVYNVSKFFTFEDKNKKVSVVVKNFQDIKSIKWTVLSIWTFARKKFALAAITRLYNEYSAHLNLRKFDIKTPKILLVLIDEKVLVTEYVDGINMKEIVQNFLEGDYEKASFITLLGKKIGKVHSFNYSLGDTKASNFIVCRDDIFFTDLEQAQVGGYKAWDLALFLYFSCKLNPNPQVCEKLTKAFLEGYLEFGEAEAVREAASLKYLTPFQVVIFPKVAETIRRTMIEVIRN